MSYTWEDIQTACNAGSTFDEFNQEQYPAEKGAWICTGYRETKALDEELFISDYNYDTWRAYSEPPGEYGFDNLAFVDSGDEHSLKYKTKHLVELRGDMGLVTDPYYYTVVQRLGIITPDVQTGTAPNGNVWTARLFSYEDAPEPLGSAIFSSMLSSEFTEFFEIQVREYWFRISKEGSRMNAVVPLAPLVMMAGLSCLALVGGAAVAAAAGRRHRKYE